ncbi:hypothetical protein ACOSQ4_031461 [Xanthoceras sorbifolium]
MHSFEIIVHFGTNIVELGYCDADHISIITLLHSGYQSRENDEFFSDSEMENVEGKIAKLINDNPLNQIVGGEIRFVIGQTHDNVYTLSELLRDYPLCFMSDRQKGVLNVLEVQFSFATTRFCVRHIYANFRLKHSGQKLKNLFWKCSRSSNLFEFNDAMAEIGMVDIDAKTWLDKIDPIHWSRHAFDQSIKCDHITNNMTESFNSMLGDHRAKTFLQLLEFIRRMVMKRFQKRKEKCLGWKTEIPPSVSKKILIASKDSRILGMLSAGNGEYELLDETRAYVVKINEATCECGGWQVSGIPCCHAMTAIGHYAGRDGVTRRIVEYVHPKLTKTAFSHTYSTMIHPIPDICVWPNLNTTPLIPPPFRTKPGRPKEKGTW